MQDFGYWHSERHERQPGENNQGYWPTDPLGVDWWPVEEVFAGKFHAEYCAGVETALILKISYR